MKFQATSLPSNLCGTTCNCHLFSIEKLDQLTATANHLYFVTVRAYNTTQLPTYITKSVTVYLFDGATYRIQIEVGNNYGKKTK